MFMELVANPIPNTRAAGLPTKLATRDSNSLWTSKVPVDNLRWGRYHDYAVIYNHMFCTHNQVIRI